MYKLLIVVIFQLIFLSGCRYNESGSPLSPPAIEYGQPVVSSPADGEVIHIGTEMRISWNNFKSKKLNLELWKKKQYYFQKIASAINNTGSFTWVIPSETPSSVSYQVKIISYENQEDFVYSGFFSIQP